jgi:Tol biopolymer transport system component
VNVTSGDTVRLITDVNVDVGCAWSPECDRIAVTGRSPDGAHLVDYPAGTINIVTCTTHGSSCAEEGPTWSPDEKWIAFAMEGETCPRLHIWATHANGSVGGLYQITTGDVNTPGIYRVFVQPRFVQGKLSLYWIFARSGARKATVHHLTL